MASRRPVRIFFSAGEPSGDLHGANLIRKLSRQCDRFEAVGYGGPEMEAAGCRLHADLTALAVMWFLRSLLNLDKFWKLFWRADRYFRDERPDAVVLIDYPGFNWWIARRAKKHGIPVFYYVPPQIWAWARWRVKKMRRLVDHVLASLPFEETWFRERGVSATFVGHPFYDEVARRPLDEAFLARFRGRPGPLVVILPGSRTQEVQANLKWFLKAAAKVRAAVPEARLAIAAFKPHHAQIARQQVEASGLDVEVHVGKTQELVHLADCAMAVSGSVSLELLYHTTPTVILYWISRPAYVVQSFFRKVKYITLVNLLSTDELSPNVGHVSNVSPTQRHVGNVPHKMRAPCMYLTAQNSKDATPFDPNQPDADRVLFPEYLTYEDKSPQIAAHVIEWLTEPAKREARVAELAQLKAEVAHGGASARAAEYILNTLAAPGRPLAA